MSADVKEGFGLVLDALKRIENDLARMDRGMECIGREVSSLKMTVVENLNEIYRRDSALDSGINRLGERVTALEDRMEMSGGE